MRVPVANSQANLYLMVNWLEIEAATEFLDRSIFERHVRGKPFYTWQNYVELSVRGMSPWRDVVDWVGGYPFEVAKPEDILNIGQV